MKHIKSAIRSEGTTSSLFTDTEINTAIQTKIKDFPQKLQEQKHLATVMVPRLLAQVIHQEQQIIAPGIQSFNSRSTQFKVHPNPHTPHLLHSFFIPCLLYWG